MLILVTCFSCRIAFWVSPFSSIKMAAAVVTGIILALFAVMFNFSVHKIDEGKIKYREALLLVAVVFQFVLVSFCGKVYHIRFLSIT